MVRLQNVFGCERHVQEVHDVCFAAQTQNERLLPQWLTGIIAVSIFLFLVFVGVLVNKAWCEESSRSVMGTSRFLIRVKDLKKIMCFPDICLQQEDPSGVRERKCIRLDGWKHLRLHAGLSQVGPVLQTELTLFSPLPLRPES